MKIKYNAAVTLSFSFLCIGILLLKLVMLPYLVEDFFTVPSHADFEPANAASYLLLFTHVLGHANWAHLFANLSFILLLGPLLEETYGSLMLFVMMATTAFVTGVLNVCFSPQALLGASGISFMMILLSSFTNTKQGEIPLTFLLVLFLFLVKDVLTAVESENISQVSHLIGGACGSLFGFLRPSSAGASRRNKTPVRRNTKKSTAAGQKDTELPIISQDE